MIILYTNRYSFGISHIVPPKSPKISQNKFVRELCTLLGHVSKHFFKKIHVYSSFFCFCFFQFHVYRKRHRIRVSYSKYQFVIQNTPNTPKCFRTIPTKCSKLLKIKKRNIYIYIYKFHNSYLVIFV